MFDAFERRMLLKLEVMQEGGNPGQQASGRRSERPIGAATGETLEELDQLCHRIQAGATYKKKIESLPHSTFSFLIWHSHDRSFDLCRFST